MKFLNYHHTQKSLIGKCVLFAFLFLLILHISPALTAQSLSSKSRKAVKYYHEAERSFNLLDYPNAEFYLKKALKTDSSFTEAYMLLGDVYRDWEKPLGAAGIYKKMLIIAPDKYPEAYYFLGDIYFENGDYRDALRNSKKFLTYSPANSRRKENAERIINNCEFAIKAVENPVPFDPVNSGSNINSQNDEYVNSVTADDEVLYFTVCKNPENPKLKNEDFCFSEREKNYIGWMPSKYLGPPVNSQGNEGALTISPDGRYLFFAGCNREDGYGSCDIYISVKKGDKWGKPVNLGFEVNSSYWESQPSLSSDGRTLYFVSNRPGGKGKSDIWKTYLQNNGTWTKPENLGDSVNTEYSEMSPFIHPDQQTLYFSSDGFTGMGGMDIFISRKKNGGEWTRPVNLGYPVNTHKDEISIIVNAIGDKAYFSSNQLKGFGGYDIYSFTLDEKVKPFITTYIKGVIFDTFSHKPLQASFLLTDLNSGEEVVFSVSDKSTGEFLVCLPVNRDYALTVFCEGYLFYSDNFSLTGPAPDIRPYRKEIPMKPVKKGESIILRNIFFEIGEYELKKQSEIELKKLRDFLLSNPSVKIEISGHTDNVGGEKFNLELSEKRAKAVFDFLTKQEINNERLVYKGYGFSKPLSTNDTEEGRAKNRRTEIRVIEISGVND